VTRVMPCTSPAELTARISAPLATATTCRLRAD
jgi:hypothetical protein